jgi:hypothetical protein
MFIAAFFKWLWVLVLPWVGPYLPAVLRNIPGVDTIQRWARRMAIAAFVVVLLGGGYLLLKSLRNPVADYVSAAEVSARQMAERNTQIEKSVAKLHETLSTRELENAALALEIEQLRKAMEDARAKSPDPDVVVFPANDPWLLQKRRR